MALEAETRVMRAIGLGQHYNWFNGSGSCAGIRRAAAEALPQALRDDPDCADPDPTLMSLVAQVARRGERSEYVLTRTWETASEVIQAHLHRRYLSDEEWLGRVVALVRHYQPPGDEPRFDSLGRIRPTRSRKVVG